MEVHQAAIVANPSFNRDSLVGLRTQIEQLQDGTDFKTQSLALLLLLEGEFALAQMVATFRVDVSQQAFEEQRAELVLVLDRMISRATGEFLQFQFLSFYSVVSRVSVIAYQMNTLRMCFEEFQKEENEFWPGTLLTLESLKNKAELAAAAELNPTLKIGHLLLVSAYDKVGRAYEEKIAALAKRVVNLLSIGSVDCEKVVSKVMSCMGTLCFRHSTSTEAILFRHNLFDLGLIMHIHVAANKQLALSFSDRVAQV